MEETIQKIKSIAQDIIADKEWVNDSHSESEHRGVVMGLTMLIKHLEETQEELPMGIKWENMGHFE
jgi:hypothetical protein